MTDNFSIVLRIAKIDEARRLVYGAAALEEPDKSREIFDYDSSKPLFEKWSSTISKVTDGKSVGNVRSMHGSIAAGRLESINFDDSRKVIDVVAKVVDDNEWKKCQEGVYTGFSVGGRYAKRWKDGEFTRYTADPSEVSLVDNPCMPGATFEMIKADGLAEQREFIKLTPASIIKPSEDTMIKQPTNDEIAAHATELAKAAGDPAKWVSFIEQAAKELTVEEKPAVQVEQPLAKVAEVAPAIVAVATTPATPSEDLEQVWKSRDGKTFKTKKDAISHNDELAKAAQPDAARDLQSAVKDLADKVEKRETAQGAALEKRDYTDDQRTKMASEGTAKPDGSFPIKDRKDLQDAISDYGRSNNKLAAKRWITSRAKALGATDLLPDSWTKMTKADEFGLLRKDLSSCARMANIIQELDWLQMGTEYEAAAEKDNSPQPKALKANIVSLCATLRAMVNEETEELLDDSEAEEFGELLEQAHRPHGVDALTKILSEGADKLEKDAAARRQRPLKWLAKMGARHSKTDQDLLNTAHDSLVALGMSCDRDAEKLAKIGARHSKVDRERLQQAHDNVVDAGASCEGCDDASGDDAEKAVKLAKSLGGDELQKRLGEISSENELLKKAISETIPVIKSLAERLDKIEKMPIPGGPAQNNALRVVEKGQDDLMAARSLLDTVAKDNPDVMAQALIRLSHQNGQRFLPGTGPGAAR